jgi:hypothetical protein
MRLDSSWRTACGLSAKRLRSFATVFFLAAPTLLLCANQAAAQLRDWSFEALDADKSGGLSREEMVVFFEGRAGAADSSRLFALWDTNGDGTLSKYEFDTRVRTYSPRPAPAPTR